MTTHRLGIIAAVFLLSTVTSGTSASWGADSPAAAAAQVDRLLSEEVLAGKQLAPVVDDAAYLRRVSLDIIGDVPTPAEITAFVLDPATDKRARVVDRLLDKPQYGQNWARYWRDVIMARRSDQRSLARVGNSVTVYLTEQFNQGTGWDKITRDFISATGTAKQNGQTALMVAQEGKTEETAAEAARIFLGFQIQCAQCHNHPYDAWKREQFHQLAAFFPRIIVRPARGAPDDVEVTTIDTGRAGTPRGGRTEHYMSDKQNPQARGTLMQPVFFLTGQSLEAGKTDAERRGTLAQWMTARDNPWFAKAYVNRVWAELLGRGFCEPIDDLGADRKWKAPRAAEYLSKQFAENVYDSRWLLRTITASAAYQRQSRSRAASDDSPFSAVVIQPLRGDVLFSAVTEALGAYEIERGPQKPGDGKGGGSGARFEFSRSFGFDPSLPRDEIGESVPQVLLLMNSPQLARGLRGDSPQTELGRLLVKQRQNDLVATELYLRTLSREPTDSELNTVLAHVRESGKRTEAFEDVLWALVNSAEFRERR